MSDVRPDDDLRIRRRGLVIVASLIVLAVLVAAALVVIRITAGATDDPPPPAAAPSSAPSAPTPVPYPEGAALPSAATGTAAELVTALRKHAPPRADVALLDDSMFGETPDCSIFVTVPRNAAPQSWQNMATAARNEALRGGVPCTVSIYAEVRSRVGARTGLWFDTADVTLYDDDLVRRVTDMTVDGGFNTTFALDIDGRPSPSFDRSVDFTGAASGADVVKIVTAALPSVSFTDAMPEARWQVSGYGDPELPFGSLQLTFDSQSFTTAFNDFVVGVQIAQSAAAISAGNAQTSVYASNYDGYRHNSVHISDSIRGEQNRDWDDLSSRDQQRYTAFAGAWGGRILDHSITLFVYGQTELARG